MRSLVQGHTTSKYQSQDLYPGQPGSKNHAPFYPITEQWHPLHLSYSWLFWQITGFFKESVLWGAIRFGFDIKRHKSKFLGGHCSTTYRLCHLTGLLHLTPTFQVSGVRDWLWLWVGTGSRCTFLVYKIQIIIMLISLGCCGGASKMMILNVSYILVSAVHFLIVHWRALHSVGTL